MAASAAADAATPPDIADLPAAQCAAFWQGYALAAGRLSALEGDALARGAAAYFAEEALRDGADAGALAAFLAREAPDRALMVEAYVYGGDATSRELTLRSITRCPAP